MGDFRLTKDEMQILSALANHTYPSSVPEEDVNDFLRLEKYGLVTHVKLDQSSLKTLYGAALTPEGMDYLGVSHEIEDPKKHIDWKWLIGIIVAVLGILATIIF